MSLEKQKLKQFIADKKLADLEWRFSSIFLI